jgi:hypothetical protein
MQGDLREQEFCRKITGDIKFDELYQLAADMGGAGYIFTGEHDAAVMHNSAAINLNMAEEARKTGIGNKNRTQAVFFYQQELAGQTAHQFGGNSQSHRRDNH